MKSKVLSGMGSGLGWGLGLGIALGVSSLAGGGLRPVAKGAVKGGLWARERLSTLTAEARERAEDIYFEALTERAAEQARLNGDVTPLAGQNGHAHGASVTTPTR